MSKSPKKSKSLTRAGNRPATISAQQTIPYVRMLPDGICQLSGGVYTKTLEYEDINYSVASAEDQTAIFSGWSSWLNYFDSSLPFQLSFVNRRSRSGSRYKVNISEADDRFNSVRTEYTGMLKNQIAKSNNGIERAKYVTFCIPAENVAAARPRLERVEADVIGNFKRLGVQSQPLDGRERLALLHGQLHPGSRECTTVPELEIDDYWPENMPEEEITADCALTDDPMGSREPIAQLKAGQKVNHRAFLCEEWEFVTVKIDGKYYWGFVPNNCMSHG